MFHKCLKGVSKELQAGFKKFSRGVQGSFKGVSLIYQRCEVIHRYYIFFEVKGCSVF